MQNEGLFRVGMDMIYLASHALSGKIPQKSRIDEMNLSKISKLAKKHSMQGIVYISLSKYLQSNNSCELDSEVLSDLKEKYERSVTRLVRYATEREALCDFLDREGIWYLFLKGILLSELYPALGMRQMGDNDILVDPRGAAKIRRFMKDRGYSVYSYGGHCHDVYVRGKFIFEIHRMLAEESGKTKTAARYYKSVEKRLLPGNRQQERRFSAEDNYIYNVFHAYKHFAVAGCGVRTLMDMFVYLGAFGDTLDREYIDRELSLLGILDYERESRELALALFSTEGEIALDDRQIELLSIYLSSGTHGTGERWVETALDELSSDGGSKRTAKLRYIISRLFPPLDFYRTGYPRAYKFIVTIPVIWFLRLFKIISHRDNIRKETRHLNKLK